MDIQKSAEVIVDEIDWNECQVVNDDNPAKDAMAERKESKELKD